LFSNIKSDHFGGKTKTGSRITRGRFSGLLPHARCTSETSRELRVDKYYTETKIPFMYSQKRNCTAPSPIFHIHVSVSDLYIPRIGPHIFLPQKRQTDFVNIYVNRSQTHECGNSFSGNNWFEFSVLCLCSVGMRRKKANERKTSESVEE
jgi:hypothetical protein